MNDALHTPADARLQRVRRRLDLAEAADLEWPQLRAAKRAYFHFRHAAAIADYEAMQTRKFTPANIKTALSTANREREAARAKLAALDQPEAIHTIADYIDAEVTDARTESACAILALRYFELRDRVRAKEAKRDKERREGRAQAVADNARGIVRVQRSRKPQVRAL